MYPVQPVISYFTTIFTTMMHVHRDVTAKQHTGGGDSWSYKYIHVKKQTQGWVRFVSYRYTAGQCRHILSFLACLSSFIAYYHLLHPAAHVPWNDRSMTVSV